MIKSISVVSVVISLAVPCVAWADECGDAVTDYNAVLVRLNDAAQKFSNCVANSLGTDNCSKEFRQLRSAYGEFESAVSVYVKQCR